MGGVNAEATLKIISERGAITSLDGEDGLGHWQAWEAAELGVVKAKEFGISLVPLRIQVIAARLVFIYILL
jgi:(2R)-3-sulfolactate dehydrogenase (NADP+)